MDEIVKYKKKNYIYFVNLKNLNNHLTNNFNRIRRKRLTSLSNKGEGKFV